MHPRHSSRLSSLAEVVAPVAVASLELESVAGSEAVVALEVDPELEPVAVAAAAASLEVGSVAAVAATMVGQVVASAVSLEVFDTARRSGR